MSALGHKQTFRSAKRHVRFTPESDTERVLSLRGPFDVRVDLAAQRPEIDRLGEKRFSAALQCLALGLAVPFGLLNAADEVIE